MVFKLKRSRYRKDLRFFRVLVYVAFLGLLLFFAATTSLSIYKGAMSPTPPAETHTSTSDR